LLLLFAHLQPVVLSDTSLYVALALVAARIAFSLKPFLAPDRVLFPEIAMILVYLLFLPTVFSVLTTAGTFFFLSFLDRDYHNRK
jgi:hypothetical protein